MDLRDNKGALSDYSKAIELNPRFIDPYVNRGVLKSEMGDYEGEIADYH
ncbi:tetratricopeptide repeat protein [Bacteroides fragilis]